MEGLRGVCLSHLLLENTLAEYTAMPVAPFEPVSISVCSDTIPLDAAAPSEIAIGRVSAPDAVTATSVTVQCTSASIVPGKLFVFNITLCDTYPVGDPDEIDIALEALLRHAVVGAELTDPATPLLANLQPSAARRGVSVSFVVPAELPSTAEVIVNRVTIAGQGVTQGWALPARVRVATGILPRLKLSAPEFRFFSLLTPAVTASGLIFVPQYEAGQVLVFNHVGASLPPIDIAVLGLSNRTIVAAVCDITDTLFLAEENGEHSVLVALDLSTRAIRWRSPPGLTGCRGLAVLSDRGVLVAACHGDSMLRVFSITDGHLLSSYNVCESLQGPNSQRPVNATVDAASGTIFVSINTEVWAFSWDGSAIHSYGRVVEADRGGNYRALAVMRPFSGSLAHLVVGTWGSGELIVLSLPDLKRVHITYLRMPGKRSSAATMCVKGLAADRTGTTLVVCDNGGFVHTLPWPLEGMTTDPAALV
jgi:hypothetical protein